MQDAARPPAQLETERKARAAAEMTGAESSSLLAIVGKDLRAPMESVADMADRILSGPLSDKQRREAETLPQSTRRFLVALTEVAEFSDLENGEAELAVERFDLHALVKNAAHALQDRGRRQRPDDRGRHGRQLSPLHRRRCRARPTSPHGADRDGA